MRDQQINFRVEPEQQEKLLRLARATRRSKSEILRGLIEAATVQDVQPRPIHIEPSVNREHVAA